MKDKIYIGLLVSVLAACGTDSAPQAPQAPTGLTATPGEGQVALAWQDNSDNETGFSIYRAEVSAAGIASQQSFVRIKGVSANTEEYTDREVAVGKLYRYSVTAEAAGVPSTPPSSGGVATSEPVKPAPTDPTPPTPPTPPSENKAPTVSDQNFSTEEDEPVSITLSGTDPEGKALTYTIVDEPKNGTLSGSGATRTYTPEEEYSGTDTFTFRVSDGEKTSGKATVAIVVSSINDTPEAEAMTVGLEADLDTVTVELKGEDPEGDKLTYAIVGEPNKGTLGDVAEDGKVTYTLNNGAERTDTDSFTYTVSDGEGTSEEATVTIEFGVAPVAEAPAGLTTAESTALDITLDASDADGDFEGTFEIVDQPENGKLSSFSKANGTVTYTPDTNFSGEDTFTFKAVSSDGKESEPATVSVEVTPVDDAPTAIALSSNTVVENAPEGTVIGDLSAEDVDTSDAKNFEYSLVSVASVNDGTSTPITTDVPFAVEEGKLVVSATPDFDFEDENKKAFEVEIQVQNVDDSGAAVEGTTYEETFTVTVTDVADEANPAITLDQTGTITVGQGEAIDLSGTASDDQELTKVEIFEGDVSKGEAKLGTADSWTFSYTQAKAGDYTLRAVAYDAAGNTSEETVELVVEDVTAPSASFVNPPSELVKNTGDAELTVTASDDEAVDRIVLFEVDDSTTPVTETEVGTFGQQPNGNWQADYPTPQNAGEVKLKAVAYDAANNEGATETITITIK